MRVGNTLVAVTYVQKVQIDFVRLSAAERLGESPFANATARVQLTDLLQDLDVARDQAISKKGRILASLVRAEVVSLRTPHARATTIANLDKIDADLGKLVRKYTADGFVYRVRADRIIAATDSWFEIAIVASALVALLVAIVLIRAILPPIRRAVSIATSIAHGKLANAIIIKGRSETSELLGSLATMQASIAESVRQADALRVSESARLAAEFESRSAREASRAKSEFLATMSHELRTPLNAILGFSEIIQDQIMGPVSPQYVGYARDIHGSGKHLLALINDVLDLSKLEAGKFEISESQVDIVQLINEAVTLVRGSAHNRQIALSEIIKPTRMLVLVDERFLKQVFLNVLSNAVKFTPEGGQITARVDLIAGEGVEIAVSDSGIGMSPAEIDIALSPFGQIDSKIARQYQGTGLGLPISRSLVELHGGRLRIRSAPGAGTTIVVSLPVSRVIQAAA